MKTQATSHLLLLWKGLRQGLFELSCGLGLGFEFEVRVHVWG